MIARLRDESGIGIPLAMGVLLLVLILAAWSVSSADQLHRTSERDRSAKQALGPADAGIQRAAWRLGQSTVAASQCIVSNAGGESVVPPVAGECPLPTATTAMGNGSAYSYVVTPQLAAGATCAGETVAANTFTRCVTATGTSRGVTRRVQTRLRAQPLALFPPRGVVAKSHAAFNNTVDFMTCAGDPQGLVGSNAEDGPTRTTNGVRFNASCPGSPAASFKYSQPVGAAAPVWGNGTTPVPVPLEPRTEPWTLPAIAPWPTSHNNDLIPTGTGITWNANTGTLSVAQGTLTLQTGTYVLCSLYLGNQGKVVLAPGAQVKIYIDSPSRTLQCPAGSGFLRTQNSNGLNWPSNNPQDAANAAAAKNLHVFVWGNPAHPSNLCSTSSVGMCNSNGFAGVLYAPNSHVFLDQSIEFVGAIAADSVYFNNSITFRFPPGLDDGMTGVAGTYRPERWTECASAVAVATDPESGCG